MVAGHLHFYAGIVVYYISHKVLVIHSGIMHYTHKFKVTLFCLPGKKMVLDKWSIYNHIRNSECIRTVNIG